MENIRVRRTIFLKALIETVSPNFLFSSCSLTILIFCYAVFGVALTVIGYLFNSTVSSYLELFNAKFNFAIVLMSLGCLLIVTSLVGLMVVFTRKRFYIAMFIFLMLIVFMLQLIAVNNGRELTKNSNFKIDVNETLHRYQFNKDKNPETFIIDSMQQNMDCCGIMKVSDWETYLNHSAPVSCCKQVAAHCSDRKENLFESSCFDQVSKYLSDKNDYIHKIITFLFVLQLIGLGASCFMCGRTRSNYEIFY